MILKELVSKFRTLFLKRKKEKVKVQERFSINLTTFKLPFDYKKITTDNIEEFIELIEFSKVPYGLLNAELVKKYKNIHTIIKARIWIEEDFFKTAILYKKYIFYKEHLMFEYKDNTLYCFEDIIKFMIDEFEMSDLDSILFFKEMMSQFTFSKNLKALVNNNYKITIENNKVNVEMISKNATFFIPARGDSYYGTIEGTKLFEKRVYDN